MVPFVSIVPELSEIEAKALFGKAEEFYIPERLIGSAELSDEIRRYLTHGRKNAIARATPADVPRINKNLREFLDFAESRCDRAEICRAYRPRSDVDVADKYSDAADTYSKAKSRFTRTRPINCAMEQRFDLVKAACNALRESGQQVDEAAACAKLFEGTSAEFKIIEMRDYGALLDAGKQLSDAWCLIAEALDGECNLRSWFAHISEDVNRTNAPISDFLEVDAIVDLSDRAIGAGPDTTFSPAYVEGFDAVNLPHHIHDLSPAPCVKLYSHRVWEENGFIKGYPTDDTDMRARLVFWRDIMLSLLPDSGGEIGPYMVNRLRVSLHRKGASASEITMRNPFVRAFDFGGRPFVPLFLAADRFHKFLPDTAFPEDHGLLVAESVRTQYAQIWGARPDVIPLYLRYHTDIGDRPIAPAIEKAAALNSRQGSFFPDGSLGAIVERATLIADRGAGVGALLRSDFQRKLSAWRTVGGQTHLPPLPFAFERAWT